MFIPHALLLLPHLLTRIQHFKKTKMYDYLERFGNHFESEAIERAIPRNQNSPQNPPFNLYAEQLPGSGTFAKAADNNLKPGYHDGGTAFIFESSLFLSPTRWALYGAGSKDEGRKNAALQEGY
jgi:homogentisate 1,2-dioxygenase